MKYYYVYINILIKFIDRLAVLQGYTSVAGHTEYRTNSLGQICVP